MKTIQLVILMLIFASFSQAQQYVDKAGTVHFFSKSPLEDIEATTKEAVVAISPSNGSVYAKIKVLSFHFHDKLMEEHFNENYLESDKFPFAILNAKIKDSIDYSKDGVYDVTLVGSLDMHGVKKDREIAGKLTVKNGVPVSAVGDFMVKLVDHKIKIPKAVMMNIAEEIKVDFKFNFEKYEKK